MVMIIFYLGHSNLICWFTSKDDDKHGPGGRNKIVNMYHVIAMNIISWNRNLVIEQLSKRISRRDSNNCRRNDCCASALHLYTDLYVILAPAQPAMPGLDRLVHCSAIRLAHGVLRIHCSTSMTSFTFINTIAKKMTRRTHEPINQVGVALIIM